MYSDLSKIKEAGFTGFKAIEQLWNDYSVIPNERGIYLILTSDFLRKQFLQKGVGGYFKGKDPNVGLNVLSANWIDSCHLLYVGQAGGNGSSSTLKKRLKQYLEFGKGKSVGHYGGRYIWQLAHHKNLLVAWKITNNTDPREEERKLMKEFCDFYGRNPFANLAS